MFYFCPMARCFNKQHISSLLTADTSYTKQQHSTAVIHTIIVFNVKIIHHIHTRPYTSLARRRGSAPSKPSGGKSLIVTSYTLPLQQLIGNFKLTSLECVLKLRSFRFVCLSSCDLLIIKAELQKATIPYLPVLIYKRQ